MQEKSQNEEINTSASLEEYQVNSNFDNIVIFNFKKKINELESKLASIESDHSQLLLFLEEKEKELKNNEKKLTNLQMVVKVSNYAKIN